MEKEYFFKKVDESDMDSYQKARLKYSFDKGIAFFCSCCGAPAVTSEYNEEVGKIMEENKWCHECLFWYEIVLNPIIMETHVISQNGDVYSIQDENDKSMFRGHGGASFYFLYEDGSVHEHTNVWSRGVCPQRFVHRFTKVKSISKKEYEVLK